MGFWSNLIGTSETAFKIGKGKSTLDASGLTADRTHALPDAGGTLALTGPSFSVYMSATQTLTSGVNTKLNFDTIRYDTHSCYSTANKRGTPGVAGKYVVSAVYDFFASTGVTIAILKVFKNGSEVIRLQDLRGSPQGAGGGTDTINITATDYIEIYAYLVATTATINGAPAAYLTSFSMTYVRP